MPEIVGGAVGGCVSSTLLNQEDDFTQLGISALGRHIVSLTSTTYGLLNLDPLPQSTTTPPTPLPPFPSLILYRFGPNLDPSLPDPTSLTPASKLIASASPPLPTSEFLTLT
ncbi:hypothetical protein J1N35_011158 [Gossypium stocksii]|uniref:Uncharacterized protein n=1 Tax=Gossypium stocksii TaxID=47602 RepID=A0A9D3W3H8_9ROSI|nr:hypothetical protein J1N35_011158 [Gossypium stocksii]